MVPQPDDAQTLTQANEEIYDRLISLIENTQGRLAPIIVACDDEALRKRVIDRYESEAWEAKIRPYRIVLGQEPSMRAGLESLAQQEPHLQRGGKAVFTVTGAEMLLRVKLNPQDEQSELDKFFGYLQWTREGLREFRYPIVLWVTYRILLELSRRAADFWSWRKAVLRFEAESPSVIQNTAAESQQLRPIADNSNAEALPPLAELQAEIAKLTAKDPYASGLATLYDRLGQVYAQRISQGIAENLEQEREHAIASFQQAIACYQRQSNSSAEMWALWRLGNFFFFQSRYADAIIQHQKSLDIAWAIKDPQSEANSLKGLGNAHSSLGQILRAIDFYQQSLEIYRKIGDRNGEGGTLCNLGHAYGSLEQYQLAVDFYQQALEAQREVGNNGFESNSLLGLGTAYFSLGQYQRAINFYQQALKISHEIGDRKGEASSFNNLGNAYSSLKNNQQAIDFYQQALEIEREIGDHKGEAGSLHNLGTAHSSLGQYEEAIDFYQQALEIAHAIGDHKGEATSLNNLGTTYYSLKQYQRAMDFYRQTVEIVREINDRKSEANYLNNLGLAHSSLKQYEEAIEFYQQALEIKHEMDNRDGEATVLFNMASALAMSGRSWEALHRYQKAKQIFQSLGLKDWVEKCDTDLYRLTQIISAQ